MCSCVWVVQIAVGKPPDEFLGPLGLTYVFVPFSYSQCRECKFNLAVDAYECNVGCNK